MNLNDIPLVENWLSQFEGPDRYIAEHMLRKLRYVGFEEFEGWIHESVKGVIEEIKKNDGEVAIAIFPVTKPVTNNLNEKKEQKPINDSAGRIAHSLRNIERGLPRFVELTPRLESMRTKKVKHIIYVDDFIGTGDRFSGFWKNEVSRSVKSWCSRGWCKIWLITYAAHTSGLCSLTHNIRALTHERVKVKVEIKKSPFFEETSMRYIISKYGTRLNEKANRRGYENLASPVIFQYGCPNNVPLIFWFHPIRRGSSHWLPLFPKRSVPIELYPLFNEDLAHGALPEELWMAKHYGLALNILDKISNYKKSHNLMLILGLLAINTPLSKIRNIMVLGHSEFDAVVKILKDGGLIDQNTAVTRFGNDVLTRAAKPCRISRTIEQKGNFFPSSFLGFHREA